MWPPPVVQAQRPMQTCSNLFTILSTTPPPLTWGSLCPGPLPYSHGDPLLLTPWPQSCPQTCSNLFTWPPSPWTCSNMFTWDLPDLFILVHYVAHTFVGKGQLVFHWKTFLLVNVLTKDGSSVWLSFLLYHASHSKTIAHICLVWRPLQLIKKIDIKLENRLWQ